MKEKKSVYLSWYDKSLKEIISVEKEFATEKLLSQLEKERIQIIESICSNIQEANKNFLNLIEELKIDEALHLAYHETPKNIQIQESEFYQYIDKKLDEAMSFYYNEPESSSKKKNRMN